MRKRLGFRECREESFSNHKERRPHHAPSHALIFSRSLAPPESAKTDQPSGSVAARAPNRLTRPPFHVGRLRNTQTGRIAHAAPLSDSWTPGSNCTRPPLPDRRTFITFSFKNNSTTTTSYLHFICTCRRPPPPAAAPRRTPPQPPPPPCPADPFRLPRPRPRGRGRTGPGTGPRTQ